MGQYSIKDIEKLSGIKAHTIRIWEKRYNIVEPKRTDTNIRYYDDNDLKKLLNISILNNKGIKISKISELSDQEIRDKVVASTANVTDFEVQIENMILSMIELDEINFERILSNVILKFGFERTIIEVVYPFFEKIGVLWQVGNINPYQEHFVSNLIRQKLMVAIDALPIPTTYQHRNFLLFLPEDELHELNLLFYNFILKKRGFRTIYLGQTVPFEDLEKVAKTIEVNYLFTAFVSQVNHDQIIQYLHELSRVHASRQIFVTGFQTHTITTELPDNIFRVKSYEHFSAFLDSIA